MKRIFRLVLAMLGTICALPALPSSVTLSTGAACVYTQAIADSGGNVSYTCAGAQPPVPPIPPVNPPPVDPTPPPAGCNASTIVSPPLPFGEIRRVYMTSGQIAAFAVIASPDWHASMALTQGQTASSPNTITEMSVSPCPGVIVTEGACYYRSGNNNANRTPDIYLRDIGFQNACTALGGQQFYVNVRWTYPDGCPFAQCGFGMQWDYGSW